MPPHRSYWNVVPVVGVGAIVLLGVAVGVVFHQRSDRNAAAPPTQHFVSRPALLPPRVDMTEASSRATSGFVFLGPKKDVVQAGPMIVDNTGQLVWFQPLDTRAITDFRVQSYDGKPVLTWWRGKAVDGIGDGYYVIVDSTYREVARVHAGNGLAGDVHEFLITPQGTALITVYHRVARDLSAIGGPKHGALWEGVVQEVEITSGRVLFEWHSAEHVAPAESYLPVPPVANGPKAAPYDYFHLNSIDVEPNGDLLISARNTHAVYEIRRSNGDIAWRLGGKRSDFAMGPGTNFAWQHDARRQPDGTLTVFDNGAAPKIEDHSRVLVLAVNTTTRRATLRRSYQHPRGLLASSQGNAQFLGNGHVMVGWGSEPFFSEFDRAGNLLLDGHFGSGADSYRVFRFPWRGQPTDDPAIAATRDGDDVLVSTSWNGATQVARWQVRVGDDPNHLVPVLSAPKTQFETTLIIPSGPRYVQVRALNARGAVIGSSAELEVP